jgi:hypothetical protein
MEAALKAIAGVTAAFGAACLGGSSPEVSIPIAAAATALGGMAGNLLYSAGGAPGSEFRRRILDRWRPIDPNHHIPLGLRHAQIVALRHVVSATDKAAKIKAAKTGIDLIRWTNVISPFAVEASKFLSKIGSAEDPFASGGVRPEDLVAAVKNGLANWGRTAGSVVGTDRPLDGLRAQVETAVLDELADGLGQSAMDLPGEFLACYRGDGSEDNPGWFLLFLRQAATQLDRDDAFARGWQAQMTALLVTLMESLAEGGAPPLDLGLMNEARPVGLDRFVYIRRWTDLVCREPEMARLLEFARPDIEPPNVRFALLYGRGGQGKSRVALEACRKAVELYGMQAGFLYRGVTPRDGWDHWRPAVPTLIVVDYASSRAREVRQVLRGLTLPGRSLRCSVRVLLLDREGGLEEAFKEGSNLRAVRSWIDTIAGGASNEAQAIKSAFTWEAKLQPVKDPWEVMSAVFRAREIEPPDRQDALEALDAIDPAGSPLFAILVADAIAGGSRPQEEDRYRFLLRAIHRENMLPFEDAQRETVLNLAAVATLTRGIDAVELPALFDELAAEKLLAPRFRPPDDDLNPIVEAIARFTGQRDGTWLHGLEPDLLVRL